MRGDADEVLPVAGDDRADDGEMDAGLTRPLAPGRDEALEAAEAGVGGEPGRFGSFEPGRTEPGRSGSSEPGRTEPGRAEHAHPGRP